jgi:UDP-GlcNAc:undecaprenyl-phosphate GlcNAc-1-phosphate transferase
MPGVVPWTLAVIAAAISLLIIPAMWRLAPRFGLVDMPDARKVHTSPVPRVGGWGIVIGSMVPALLWLKLDPLLQSYVAASLVLFLFGVWDDLRDIGHWSKFAGQILAACTVVYLGGLSILHLPFMDGETLNPAVGRPLTVFALVGVINAVNHSDGLDGLAAGESMLTLIGLLILGYLSASVLVVTLAMTSMGGLLGFLRFNSYPARVFMGDAGSQVLGFTLGFLTIYLTQVANPALSPVVPLLLLGVPIVDILSVLLQRIREGVNWFRASRNHVHHRLLDLGLTHYQSVIVIYTAHAACVLGAVLMRYQTDSSIALLYASLVAGAFAALTLIERLVGAQKYVKPETRGTARSIRPQGRAPALRQGARALIALIAPTLMLLGSIWSAKVPRDIGLVAALLAALFAAELLFSHVVRSLIVRITVYVAAIASIYLVISYPGIAAQRPIGIAMLVLVCAMVPAITAYVRCTSQDTFRTSPTDYLIVFLLLALVTFAGIDARARSLVETIVCAVVLLYGCEVLIVRTIRRWSGFNLATLAVLAIMAVRGLA